jgi:hypothetical protein
MFKWFRRRSTAPVAKSGKAASKARPRSPATDWADLATEPAPLLPEVVAEGNTQADWSVWEDSVMSLDSQLQDLMPSHRVMVRGDTQPVPLEEPDAFSNVNKNRDV